ncbi:unnamed protein product, partial [Laminaria digitata]
MPPLKTTVNTRRWTTCTHRNRPRNRRSTMHTSPWGATVLRTATYCYYTYWIRGLYGVLIDTPA